MSIEAHLLDDGAHEVVDARPARARAPVVTLQEVVMEPIGGKMARMRAQGDRALREFLLIRSPAGAAKVTIAHAPVFRALVRANLQRRTQGVEDTGVSVAELAEASGLPPEKVRSVLASLVKNRAVRSKAEHLGWQGYTARYYPTDLGRELFAMAERWGEGVMVQIGSTSNAWKDRSQSEPPNLFQHADLIRRNLA
ncbi:hypothetical protein CcrC1_gp215 [Caulobacter phage C1]|nr:hypothetical protein CcrC1_gp215 [Caulobacter phage C1]UTU08444.1 hypothetical protein CcrC2_gp216 [Caulobacter phage C2]UTU08961.1 hypothetical protein CcrJ4_gp210 [Caulobacter phage J4]UTU10077.1 hypothetical protein CcrRB23_gp215 [Caulobacter phage RB23]WGN97112.1 hypothetical protein [Bertelyvirus sp.]